MSKAIRILSMYDRLYEGKMLVKSEEAVRFRVEPRTIQRDIDDIRAFLADEGGEQTEVIYDRRKLGYVMKKRKIV